MNIPMFGSMECSKFWADQSIRICVYGVPAKPNSKKNSLNFPIHSQKEMIKLCNFRLAHTSLPDYADAVATPFYPSENDPSLAFPPNSIISPNSTASATDDATTSAT